MDDKTFAMVKRSYGLLKAAYVLLIIIIIIEVIMLLIGNNQQNDDVGSILSFWPSIVLIAACYFMLYNKSPYRSKYIAVSMLIYAVWNIAAAAVIFFTNGSGASLYPDVVRGILFFSAGILIVFLSFKLLQKTYYWNIQRTKNYP